MIHTTSIDAYRFAQMLISQLRALRPEAAPLKALEARGAADIGIEDDGEFEPLLRVKSASKACNVMSLWVNQRQRWEPTSVRGTPAEIAAELSGPFDYLWKIPVLAMGLSEPEPRSPPHPATPPRRRRPSH